VELESACVRGCNQLSESIKAVELNDESHSESDLKELWNWDRHTFVWSNNGFLHTVNSS
jgi:hypothetical protein